MTPEEKQLYKQAKKRVRRVKAFYSNALTYLVICSFLSFVNWYTHHGDFWVKWVWIGWGIGVFFHGVSLYKRNIIFSDDWEERKIKKEMERLKKD